MENQNQKELVEQKPIVVASSSPSFSKLDKHKSLFLILAVFFVLSTAVFFAVGSRKYGSNDAKNISGKDLLSPSPSVQETRVLLSPTNLPSVVSSVEEIEGQITFVRGDICRGERDIWIINADGSREQKLTTEGTNDRPTFSPDGRWLAYLSVDEKTKKQIIQGNCLLYGDVKNQVRLVRADGSGYRELLTTAILIPNDISWSPDSKKIALFGLKNSEVVIVVIDIDDGSEQVFEDPGPPGKWPEKPVWLTENEFLYVKYVNQPPILENSAAVLADLGEKDPVFLTKDIRFTSSLTPFDDGKKVFFWTEDSFWQMDIGTNNIQKIKPVPENLNLSGSKLDDQKGRLINVKVGKEEDIIIVRLAEGKIQKIKTGLKINRTDYWCTDGNWLILSVEDNAGKNELWKFHLETGIKEKLVGNASSPDWYFSEQTRE
ncbi:MAG TPA: hypothetical protein VMW41_05960 [Candidatus Bathyarchaeia archaeon]|nr:hypothetical protein [Candidatus Bathyarchaeia archaeon]